MANRTAAWMKEKARAAKKVEIAIDKLVDLQDMGFVSDLSARSLDLLRELLAKLQG
jgi:hypothetical protein